MQLSTQQLCSSKNSVKTHKKIVSTTHINRILKGSNNSYATKPGKTFPSRDFLFLCANEEAKALTYEGIYWHVP